MTPSFQITPLTEAEAREMATWQYEGPYSFYNAMPPLDESIASFLDPAYRYHAIRSDGGALLAFCCFGEDAQVGGYAYDERGAGCGNRDAP